MKLGIIGVGHLATAFAKGLLGAGHMPALDIVLSPRGQSIQLHQQFGCLIARDNASLVEQCDTVLLAVRPEQAVAAIADLPWRSDHVLMTACAGVSTQALAPFAAQAKLVRIMPTVAAEFGESATLIYPGLAQLTPLLDAIGKSFVLDSEDQFEVGSVSAAIFGWAQALIQASSAWSAQRGMDEDQARALLAQTFVSAGATVAGSELPVSKLLDNLATPGGITETGLNHLDDAGAIEAWNGASNAALAKLEKTA